MVFGGRSGKRPWEKESTNPPHCVEKVISANPWSKTAGAQRNGGKSPLARAQEVCGGLPKKEKKKRDLTTKNKK